MYQRISFKLCFLLILLITKGLSNDFSINLTTEITFNLDTKNSTFEQGINLNYKTYTLSIIYQKFNNQNSEIIKGVLSKELATNTNVFINKIYILNQNVLGIAFEKELKTESSLYLEFLTIKNLNYFNFYYYHSCNDNFYLKLGFDNINFKKDKIQKIIGFYHGILNSIEF